MRAAFWAVVIVPPQGEALADCISNDYLISTLAMERGAKAIIYLFTSIIVQFLEDVMSLFIRLWYGWCAPFNLHID